MNDAEFLATLGMPAPTLSVEESHRRRMTHRNERKIYRRTCDLTGKEMISIYPADTPFPVYSPEVWWGDNWDPMEHGRDFDFSRPFFEQFAELAAVVPRLALMNKNSQNSEYCNLTTGNNNCFLVFGGDNNEDCMYSLFNMRCRDTHDVYWGNQLELCYDCVDCHGCYNVRYSQNAVNCMDSSFLFECRNCEKCFGCVGLNKKKYHIFNQPYSPEEYEKKLAEFRLNTWSGVQHMKQEFERFRLQFPHRASRIVNSENCSGDFIVNGRNCENAFAIEGPAEDMKDVFLAVGPLKDVLRSCHFGHNSELFYEMVGSMKGYHCALSRFAWGSQYVYYCDTVDLGKHLFGCVSLKRKEYCILNKQYSKEEYEALMPRIIEHMKSTGEWGEFFPMHLSPFAYNESVAQDFFPMSKEEALAAGLKWRDEELAPRGAAALPEAIENTDESLTQLELACEATGRAYRINKKELAFHKRMGIPLSRLAPETRNEKRLAMRTPIRTWDRSCDQCQAAIKTSYAPERPERVYCEACFLAEMY